MNHEYQQRFASRVSHRPGRPTTKSSPGGCHPRSFQSCRGADIRCFAHFGSSLRRQVSKSWNTRVELESSRSPSEFAFKRTSGSDDCASDQRSLSRPIEIAVCVADTRRREPIDRRAARNTAFGLDRWSLPQALRFNAAKAAPRVEQHQHQSRLIRLPG